MSTKRRPEASFDDPLSRSMRVLDVASPDAIIYIPHTTYRQPKEDRIC
jgi:hypothetical protein